MAKDYMTDADVDRELERLKQSEAVKLARLENRWKYRRRQQVYQLRYLEKRGKELMAQGITADSFRFSDDDPEADFEN